MAYGLKRTFAFLLSILTASLAAPSQPDKAPEVKFKVLVLDALDGKPQPGVLIEYFCEGKLWNRSDEVPTGSDGVAVIPFRCEQARIEVSASVPSVKKEECGGLDARSIDDILHTGIISKPTGAGSIWCPTKQSRKLKPVPGQIIIFIKKPTWWQAHVAG